MKMGTKSLSILCFVAVLAVIFTVSYHSNADADLDTYAPSKQRLSVTAQNGIPLNNSDQVVSAASHVFLGDALDEADAGHGFSMLTFSIDHVFKGTISEKEVKVVAPTNLIPLGEKYILATEYAQPGYASYPFYRVFEWSISTIQVSSSGELYGDKEYINSFFSNQKKETYHIEDLMGVLSAKNLMNEGIVPEEPIEYFLEDQSTVKERLAQANNVIVATVTDLITENIFTNRAIIDIKKEYKGVWNKEEYIFLVPTTVTKGEEYLFYVLHESDSNIYSLAFQNDSFLTTDNKAWGETLSVLKDLS